MKSIFVLRRRLALLLTAALLLPLLCLPVSAADNQARKQAADALHTLGLFNGVGTLADGSPDYALGEAATRQVAATMLIRLMGKEEAALGGTWTLPFADFDGWAQKYIGYAYENKLVAGTGAHTFSGRSAVTAQQYLTMLLRALGYRDSAGGAFTYATACAFADQIGLSDGSYTNTSTGFTRGDIAFLSHRALQTAVAGSNHTLYETLFGRQPTAEAAEEILLTGNGVTLDMTAAANGYVRVKYDGASGKKLKVLVKCPNSGATYQYDLNSDGQYETLPFSDGEGRYTVGVYQNVTGSSYATLFSRSVTVTLRNSFAPFLHSNQYVNYAQSQKVAALSTTLTRGKDDELAKLEAIYNYVITGFTYDHAKASSVRSGYLPDIDAVLAARKGICFDYAAVMAAMLRCQSIPAKLVVGYVTKESGSKEYHAWLSVYTSESGWVEAVVFFDGKNWRFMDPTFAAGGATDYANDATKYSQMYAY